MNTTEEVMQCITEKYNKKFFKSPEYNYIFDKVTGNFARWGATLDQDPPVAPAPEILDLEISVNGCPKVGGKNCEFCYKSNTTDSPCNMSLETFKTIIDKMPFLTQIAFGITGVQTNPDFIPMMEYAREKGIIPNFTMSGADLTDKLAKDLNDVMGGCAISAYDSAPELCYNTVEKMTQWGNQNVNIHVMLSRETLKFVYEVMDRVINDDRLSRLHALVLLTVKPKGRAKGAFTSVTDNEFATLVEYALENGIPLGFDSCAAPRFEKAITDTDYEFMKTFSESCESTLMSAYINAAGEFFPCSFTEGECITYVHDETIKMYDADAQVIEYLDWNTGIDVVTCNDFVHDVWNSNKTKAFREKLLSTCQSNCEGCRMCPTFPEIYPKGEKHEVTT
jgi:hypothetical protein